MRVLLVTFRLPSADATTGASIVMHNHLMELIREHQVTILTFAAVEPNERATMVELRGRGVRVIETDKRLPAGIVVWKRKLQRLMKRYRSGPPRCVPHTSTRMQSALDELLTKGDFDLLEVEHVFGLTNYRFGASCPTMLIEHEVDRAESNEPRGVGMIQSDLWHQFDLIQVFTPRDARAIAQRVAAVGDRVRVNPFSVTVPPLMSSSDEETDSLVFVGGFDHAPNVDAALWLADEIMPIIRSMQSGASLTIVGANPPRSVRRRGNDHIFITGEVKSVAEYVARSAVVLAPMRIGGGMRVKVLQAMAAGKAVVTTPLGAEGLIPMHGVLPLAIGNSAQEIAREAAHLLGACRRRRELGRKARRLIVEHHSSTAYRRRLEAIHAELMSKTTNC